MASDDEPGPSGETAETARTVGQLVKYSREVNQSDTVSEVGSYALEATFHVMEGHPMPTVFEVGRGDVTVLESMSPGYATGDEAGPIARRALDAGDAIIVADEAAVADDGDDAAVVSPEDVDGPVDAAVSIAASRVFEEETGTVGVVLLVQWDALETVQSHHIKPVKYLTDHLATAVSNIRSHERLERARNDLARRKEMIEMYDRLLRHDLGNDLQIMTGYSDALVSILDGDDQIVDYAEKIQRTATNAADLVGRVGDVVKTLESETEPEPQAVEPILSDVVRNVDAKFERLTVEYDPEAFTGEIYAGNLLDSVFANVLSNAAVHNEGDVTVEVYADEPSPDELVVGFADDGSGIAEDVRDDIFEMGKKGPDSEGTGFGLGLARTLVESYGGAVGVHDSHLGGADFRLTLERA